MKATMKEAMLEEKSRVETGLSAEEREGVVEILNTLLSDEYVLYTKTRNYHWNVTGPHFSQLHEFFEDQYRALSEMVDDVAERARALGGWSLGSMREFQERARLEETPGRYPDAREMVRDLLRDHEAVIQALRHDADTVWEKYHDLGTNDFLTGLMERHEEMAWMLRSFLRGDWA